MHPHIMKKEEILDPYGLLAHTKKGGRELNTGSSDQ
jgi:hypothetical protein